MGRYIIKRLLEIIPVLFIITFIVCFLVRLSGDPVNTMLPPEATPQDRQEMREALGLDKPVLEPVRHLSGRSGPRPLWYQPALRSGGH